MEGVVPLPLTENVLQDLLSQAKDYAMSHGIVLRTKETPEKPDHVIHAPFQLFPSPVPRQCFLQAQKAGKPFNLLMHRVAHDYKFLRDCLENTIKVDDFTRRMWNIYETVRTEGISQSYSLALNRSDYMLDYILPTEEVLHTKHKVDVQKVSIKQVEFNTMASSFGGLSAQMTKYHRYMLGILNHKNIDSHIPKNEALDGLSQGVICAWKAYNKPQSVVLFLVYETERNIYDQRWLEYAIRNINPEIKIIRRSLQQLGSCASLQEDKSLIVDGQEVAVVYFRMCYTPNDFHGEKDWETRLMVERSRAIKCPNIYYHLSGTKKVQQVLAQPGMVERFVTDPEEVRTIRDTFAGQYNLDLGEEGNRNVEMAMNNPEKFVLKPQREGGGNNTFGEAIRDLLTSLGNSEERNAYILMERILPAPLQNYPIVSGTDTKIHNMISEIGMFGVLVGSADDILMNEQHGHILRTKTQGTDEGGVATGYSALDSPYLV